MLQEIQAKKKNLEADLITKRNKKQQKQKELEEAEESKKLVQVERQRIQNVINELSKKRSAMEAQITKQDETLYQQVSRTTVGEYF